MKRFLKWTFIGVAVLIVLVIGALIIVPMFVDIQEYKPLIERKVSEATGRPFSIGGELKLSLFPWAGIAFSDLTLGNPPGFKEKHFVSIKSFDLRVKLLPLLTKDIQIKRFVVEAPALVLEKTQDGRGNWEGLGAQGSRSPAGEPGKAPEGGPAGGIPFKALAVGECAVREGSILMVDAKKGERRQVSGVTLSLRDVSLDKPIHLSFSASLDGRPVSVEGDVGPLGRNPGEGTIPVDLSIKAIDQIVMKVNGKVTAPAVDPQFELAVALEPFSPRKAAAALGRPFPVATTDPKVLDQLGLKAQVRGNPKRVAVSEGVLDLDGSTLNFSLEAKDFSRPDVAFDLALDRIDLDPYLPPPGEEKAPEKAGSQARSPKGKTDYTPLRRLVLDGSFRAGQLVAKGAKVQDLVMKITAKNGILRIHPLTMKLYKGNLSGQAHLDVRREVPKSTITVKAKEIHAGPLIRDVLKKDVIEGALAAAVALTMKGDDPAQIKKSLNGKGSLLFEDGAIVGIDLAGMVRNVKSTFGFGEKGGERPRTDFSEFNAPFTITNGVVHTANTEVKSPLFRVHAAGTANLVEESLDFRVEPKLVATIKGQGDTKQRAGLTVPVLVTGTFSAPKFRPDLKGMLKKVFQGAQPQPSDLKKLLPGTSSESKEGKPVGEAVKGLLKGLPFGN